MKQVIMDKVDWIAYIAFFTVLCMITTFLIYVPIKLHKIEKLLTPKATTETTTIPEKGDIEDLIRDFRAIGN